MINSEEFTNLTQTRCDIAEDENDNFKLLEDKFCKAFKGKDLDKIFDLSLQLRCLAEEICYKKGFTDALSLATKSCSQIV